MAAKVSVIAIDGPVGAGKTVVGLELARRLAFQFLDTGVMYRAVTWLALQRSISMEDESTLTSLAQNNSISFKGQNSDTVLIGGCELGPELRDPQVDKYVSQVSRVSGVRRALLEWQRMMARDGKVVVVGRDIGTVVLPDAPLKIFMSASVQERARRRLQELRQKGLTLEFEQVLRETEARDCIDSNRADSPLRPARDSVIVDTDGLSINQVVDQLVQRACQESSAL